MGYYTGGYITGVEAFVGRGRELGVLEELAGSGRAELFVLYGRRRVGKTELLQRFCEGRRSVYFLAAQVRDKDNLAAFKQALREALDDPLLDAVDFPDWAAALAFAAERAGDERLVVVLDEFPYLVEGNRGLPSLLQRFWDGRGKRSKLMLVLCGSHVSFMEREVLAERSPLFGRRTGQRRLEPLSPFETLRFFPRWPLVTRLEAYAILGGMPAYLRRFDDGEELETNVLREILRPEGYLFDEVQFLLRSEMNQPATYNSILGAVAAEAERVGDVAAAVGVDSTTANKYLSTLRELGLVQRHVPLTDPDPLRSRRGTYRIADRFLAFHYRHVQPNLSSIEAGRGARVWERFVAPDLVRLVDDAKGDFVLHHLEREGPDMVQDELVEVGRHNGAHVRALARTAGGAWIAAVLPPPEGARGDRLEAELEALRQAFDAPLHRLRYAFGNDPSAPLRASLLRDESAPA